MSEIEIEKYLNDVAKYTDRVNKKRVENLVEYLGPVLSSRDASLVACSDQAELDRVRESFIEKKLEVFDPKITSAALAAVCKRMEGENNKNRVTFYYLLTEELCCCKHLA